MHFIVMCDDEASFATAKSVAYIKGCATAVAFSLEARGGNIITFTNRTLHMCKVFILYICWPLYYTILYVIIFFT